MEDVYPVGGRNYEASAFDPSIWEGGSRKFRNTTLYCCLRPCEMPCQGPERRGKQAPSSLADYSTLLLRSKQPHEGCQKHQWLSNLREPKREGAARIGPGTQSSEKHGRAQ
ncbi:hypothetical protein Salat_1886400 [Sesamum alatum]|uniref:Uncharacterized protein n=1 Tax=Sesamum alatum TaxID=300844 RepID=A0AAE1Y3I6_9LAMI|nr:hypothetical protein Salat_1886400 [Sesamum alatum]